MKYKRVSQLSDQASDLAKKLKADTKYGIRFNDGTYETLEDGWLARNAEDMVLQTPDELRQSGIGMCHDVTHALSLLLAASGIKHENVMLKGSHRPDLPTHSFVLRRQGSLYDILDPLSYEEAGRYGFPDRKSAIEARISDWRKEGAKGHVTISTIPDADWSRRDLLDFLHYKED